MSLLLALWEFGGAESDLASRAGRVSRLERLGVVGERKPSRLLHKKKKALTVPVAIVSPECWMLLVRISMFVLCNGLQNELYCWLFSSLWRNWDHQGGPCGDMSSWAFTSRDSYVVTVSSIIWIGNTCAGVTSLQCEGFNSQSCAGKWLKAWLLRTQLGVSLAPGCD